MPLVDNHVMTDISTPAGGAIRHLVNIRLSPALDASLRLPLEKDLQHLVDEHPHAIAATLHRDLGRRPASPVTATWLTCLDFSSMADFEAYLVHPLHVEFLKAHQSSMEFITAIQVPLVGFA